MHTPVEVTEEALAEYEELAADCVVAIGGGSTTGLGKAIALRTDAPQLVIPTTYAGSEVTPILGETADGEKKTHRSPKVLPEAVIYDVELTLSLPARLSATSGMNAMAHAVEALYARGRQPDRHDDGGGRASRLRGGAAERSSTRRSDLEARTNAQYGAWLAACASPRPRWRCITSSAMCLAAPSTCRMPRRMRSCCRTLPPTTRRPRPRRWRRSPARSASRTRRAALYDLRRR